MLGVVDFDIDLPVGCLGRGGFGLLCWNVADFDIVCLWVVVGWVVWFCGLGTCVLASVWW